MQLRYYAAGRLPRFRYLRGRTRYAFTSLPFVYAAHALRACSHCRCDWCTLRYVFAVTPRRVTAPALLPAGIVDYTCCYTTFVDYVAHSGALLAARCILRYATPRFVALYVRYCLYVCVRVAMLRCTHVTIRAFAVRSLRALRSLPLRCMVPLPLPLRRTLRCLAFSLRFVHRCHLFVASVPLRVTLRVGFALRCSLLPRSPVPRW